MSALLLLQSQGRLSTRQIAERLEIPVGTVKSRMAEAVRRLRRALTQEE